MDVTVKLKGKRHRIAIPEPIHTFKVYPGRDYYQGRKIGHYFHVNVFETQMEMMFWSAANGSGVVPENINAMVMAYDVEKNGIKNKCLGSMVFHRERLGCGIVSHEASHAVIRWMERMKMNKEFGQNLMTPADGFVDVNDIEEVFCYAVGEVTSQIYHNLWDKGTIQ